MNWLRWLIDELKERIENNRPWAAAILAFSFGGYGAHKFMLGYKKEGLIMLSVTIIGALIASAGVILRWDWLCYAGIFVYATVHIVSIAEGLVYLSNKEWEFYAKYVMNHRGWF